MNNVKYNMQYNKLRISENLLWPLLLFLVLVVITVFMSWTIHRQSERYTNALFSEAVDNLSKKIQLRMYNNKQILYGVRGLFDASKSVERNEFSEYIKSLQLEENSPGIQLVGFSQWLELNNLAAAIELVRKDGYPAFNIYPQGKRDHYSMIVFAEPFVGRNLAAFGFDMFSESIRRQAMIASVETMSASLSSKVTLVQENKGPIQAGTLLYIPIFKKSAPLNSSAERWQALEGFVYSAYRMNDLIDGIVEKQSENVDFMLYSGSQATPEKILFNSNAQVVAHLPSKYQAQRELKIFGQTWLLSAVAKKSFEKKTNTNKATYVLFFGLIMSFLLCVLFYVLSRQRQHAIYLADSMTIDVRAKNLELKNSQERFELALESSSMGVWSLRLEDNYLQWDSSMFQLFGFPDGTVVTTYESFLALIYKDDRQRVFEEIAHAIEGQHGYDTEYRIVWPDNSIHYLASRAKIIYESDGEVSMIGTCWDISERKRLDKIKTEFVSTVSHELRTPLTAITGALGLVVSGALCEFPEKAQNILDIAYKNSQRLKLLINDLLDMDKLAEGKLEFHCEPQLLMPLIERATQENKAYADQFQVRFSVVPTDQMLKANIEENRFLQVMANFLSNAAKFSKPNSSVLIRLETINDFLRISIIDTGMGLDEASQAHIFEKFYQADSSDKRNKGGTGLGLAITKEIVERMGGRVGFASVFGEGSTFYAEFPLSVS